MPNQDDNQNPPVSDEMKPPVPPIVDEEKNTNTPNTSKPESSTKDNAPPPPPVFSVGNQPLDSNTSDIPNPPPAASDVVGTPSSGSPTKNFFTKKVVATFLGILLLVGGVISGIILVQRQQDIRKQAGSIGGLACTSPKGIIVTSKSQPGLPGDLGYKPIPQTYNVGETVNFQVQVKNESNNRVSDHYHFFAQKVVEAPRGQTPNPNLTEPEMYSIHNDPSRGTSQVTKFNSGNQPFTLEPGATQYLKYSWKPTECGFYQIDMGIEDFFYVNRDNSSQTCQITQTPDRDAVAAAGFIKVVGCDVNPTATPTIRPTSTPQPTPTPTTRPGVTPTPTATPAKTTPPSAPQGGACFNIRTYDLEDNELSIQDLSNLQPGDRIKFVVAGVATPNGTYDRARFRVTTGDIIPSWNEVTTSDEDSTFYYIYTIPDDAETFKVEAQIHHSVSGWL